MTEQTPPPYTLDNLTGQPPARTRSRWPWIAAAAAVVVALAGLAVWIAMPSIEDKAVEKCQAEVESRLKAPASAEYAVTEIEVRGTTGHVFIDGTVDAQNSFGAKIRNTWHCELYTENGGDTWSVNALRLT